MPPPALPLNNLGIVVNVHASFVSINRAGSRK